MRATSLVFASAVFVLATPTLVAASSGGAGLRADVEIDPIAYALDGYSLHVGFGYERLRFDLGAFAMRLPEFVHGQKGFTASFDGFGVKGQYFLFADQSGPFVGVGGGVANALVRRKGTSLAARSRRYSAGANLGWRLSFGSFYVTPWVGFDYTFNHQPVTLDGDRFVGSAFSIFPTVHFGYRFL